MRTSAEPPAQAETAWLIQQLDTVRRRLANTGAALRITGQVRVLLEQIFKSADIPDERHEV